MQRVQRKSPLIPSAPWPLLTATADIQLQMPALIVSTQLQIPVSTTSLIQVFERTVDTGVYVGVDPRPDGGANRQMIYLPLRHPSAGSHAWLFYAPAPST